MDIPNMRAAIKKAYDNAPSWIDKVNRMADSQVCAIYYNLSRTGKLNPKPQRINKKEQYRQMTLFDEELGGLRMHE